MSLDDSSDHILEVIDRVPWHDMRAGGINDFELLPDGDCCHTADSAAYACGCVGSGGHDNILKRRMKRHIERHGRLACAEAEVEAAAAIVSGKVHTTDGHMSLSFDAEESTLYSSTGHMNPEACS